MMEFDPLGLEEVERWRSGFDTPPDYLATLTHWVGMPAVLVVAELLVPSFVRKRGCVLLPWSFDEDSFEQWWHHLDRDRNAVESTLNHLHLWDLLAKDSDATTEAGLDWLGASLTQSWSDQLRRQVPSRRFEVRFVGDPEQYGPTVEIISLADELTQPESPQ